MKILQEPNFLPAKCPCCGTVFEVEEGDEIGAKCMRYGNNEIFCECLVAECPICHFSEVPLPYNGHKERL